MTKIKFIIVFIVMLITGCDDLTKVSVADFETPELANKVIVLLNKHKIEAELSTNKNGYDILVDNENALEARIILSKFNLYFKPEDLNDLLESKFASLSKLESIKSNLLEGREIYNKLNIIPEVLRSGVIVSGMGVNKKISVIIISLTAIDGQQRESIERFLRGVISDGDSLTVEYLVSA